MSEPRERNSRDPGRGAHASKPTPSRAHRRQPRPRPLPRPPSATFARKLVAGEQFVLAAAGGIVVIYLIWQFLLDYRIFVGNFTVVVAVLTVLAIWVHRWGHYDFGNGLPHHHRRAGHLAGALRPHQPARLGARWAAARSTSSA